MRPQTTSLSPAIESKIRRSLPKLYSWYRRNRRPLPWRTRPTPYRTAVAEFMCQQTRITAVIPYYLRWLKSFPGWPQLARASSARVLRLWEGLGYYRRARFLHRLAKEVVGLPCRELPPEPHELRKLPGIGDYTAGAIASIAFKKPAPAFDGNVARVLGRLAARHGLVRDLATLRALAGRIVPKKNPGLHNQALMELGALVCLPKNPRCAICPLRGVCPSRKKLPATSRLKPAPTVQHEFILIPWRSGKIWLTPSHPLGRWRGLSLLPTLQKKPAGARRMRIRYPFTRYWVHAAIHLSSRPPQNIPGRWMTPAEVRRATLPAPHRKILAEMGIG